MGDRVRGSVRFAELDMLEKKDFSVPDQVLFLRATEPKRRRRLESAEEVSLKVVLGEVVELVVVVMGPPRLSGTSR